jgi:CheY-like chemotaxis protein
MNTLSTTEVSQPSEPNGWRILVADDDHDAADTLALLLEWSGYSVRTAYDGRDAVEIAREFHPEVVIMDINMPVMDGFKAAQTLRLAPGAPRRVVLIALTGHIQPPDRERARDSGFDMILPKPLGSDDLRHVIDGMLGTAIQR